MYTLAALCRDIQLPSEVTETVLRLEQTLDLPELAPAMGKLRRPGFWQDGLAELKALLGDDPRGFKMLTCQLLCAVSCRDAQRALGFSEKIYADTFACFTRFVGEHLESFGCYGFDRGFWTVRQVSNRLFRIGVLEYELLTENGKNVVSLHIPSDADMSLPLLRSSYLEAKALIDEAFPDFRDVPYVCGSWLLSPDLKALLPDSSRILQFQRSFVITGTFADEEFKEWVYKRTDIPNEALPEDTTLQRSLKAFLLAGNTFRSGEGHLIPDPFRS